MAVGRCECPAVLVLYSRYSLLAILLYLQRTGCSWRALPGDFPKWRTVHSYFQRWIELRASGISILEEALKNQVVVQRRKQERNEATTFLIVDAQSVKNTDTAMEKGYDAGKKVSGIKRHIVKYLKNRNGVSPPCCTACIVKSPRSHDKARRRRQYRQYGATPLRFFRYLTILCQRGLHIAN